MRCQMLVRTLLLFLAAMPCVVAARATPDAVRVVQEVVLVRHGIRAPTAAPDALAEYAAQPWPAWQVQPGQLTAHGAALMRSWGIWYRGRAVSAGVPVTCDGVRVIADSTPRNRDSAAALMPGLGCAATYDAFAPEHADPLFHGAGEEKKSPDSGTPRFSTSALQTLQNVLLGCTDRTCLEQAKAQGKQVPMLEPAAKALKQAGTLSENLMLEYVQGMPLPQVGWGRADAGAIVQMITLHNDSFAFTAQSPAAARARSGNMLVHIVATLRTSAHMASAVPSLATHGQRLVILVGHDTDLASTAGLLQLHWHNAVQTDDYPPAGTLIYQLVERHGQYAVRLFVAQPSLSALRAADVTHGDAMVVTPLSLPACGNQLECPLPRFAAMVDRLMGTDHVVSAGGDEPTVK